MSQYLSGSLLVTLWVAACGGTTGETTPAPTAGSTSTGGGTAGSASAGSSSAGATTGGTSAGGSESGAGSSAGGSGASAGSGSGGVAGASGGTAGAAGEGGTGSVDPRCPPKLPSGACTAEQADALCEYDLSTGCLCYSQSALSLCVPVDAECTAGRGAAPPPSGEAGSAGKIALPPKRACRCSAGSWQCSP